MSEATSITSGSLIAAGKALGDSKLTAEGKSDKVEGKIQNAIGGLKDAVKNAMKE